MVPSSTDWSRWNRRTDGLSLGTEACWFNQANLIAPGREFTALVTLNNHTAPGFNPDDTGSNPAESG